MNPLTKEKIKAWRSLGAAYVEHMPDGEAMFEALCDMALSASADKIPVAWQTWHSGVKISISQFSHDADRWEKEGGALIVVPLFYESGLSTPRVTGAQSALQGGNHERYTENRR